ncbi:MAG: serine protein kinase RIO [Planctomycetes bacterium]|nr:serine protein kinase RIO [Planctomycetota bacterium]MCW8134328.1 serine protein kinase RIO [Planctomycetota bacterium]
MDIETKEALDGFVDLALITEVLYTVKSGKEATVFACKAHPDTGAEYLAAKVYKHLKHRSFRNDAVYQENRTQMYHNTRVRRAYDNGSEFGLEVHFMLWVGQEWEHLTRLYNAGVYVPVPVRQHSRAILMEYFGDADGPKPLLHAADLTRQQAQEAWQLVKANIEMMLGCNLVHGDLSPYNILVDAESPSDMIRIIDLPQAVDARFNASARDLLLRDVETTFRWFAKRGVRDNAKGFANDLWRRFKRAEL